MKAKHRIADRLFFLLLTILVFSSCANSKKDIIPSAEYAPFVNAYTGGVISQTSNIRIELTQDQPMVDLNNELKENPFSFSPSLKGKAYWISNNTIEFIPEPGTLKPGEFYEGTFQLGRFIEVNSRLKEFKFSFRVQEPNFTLYIEPLTTIDIDSHGDLVTLKGEVRFSDATPKEAVEKMLSAKGGNGQSYPVSITPTDHPTRYQFEIAGVIREAEDYQLEITANGSPAGIDRKLTENVLIPAKNDFRFLSAKRIDEPENGIEIVFSDPVSTTQDLNGLIEIPEVASSIFQVENNKVYVYFEANQLSKLTLKIHEGVKNSRDKSLGTSHSIAFSELNLKPQVSMSTSAVRVNLFFYFTVQNAYPTLSPSGCLFKFREKCACIHHTLCFEQQMVALIRVIAQNV